MHIGNKMRVIFPNELLVSDIANIYVITLRVGLRRIS